MTMQRQTVPTGGGDGQQETEQRLVARYATCAAEADSVRDAVAGAYGRLVNARVTSFVGDLVERSVRRRLG